MKRKRKLSTPHRFRDAKHSKRKPSVTIVIPVLSESRTIGCCGRFPELADFVQLLGGIIAARRSFLQQLRFENDYGVEHRTAH